MKILELKIIVSDNVIDSDLVELGEHFQRTLPIENEEISDITFEIQSLEI